MPNDTKRTARQDLDPEGNGYLAYSLANTSVSPSDNGDLSGKIWDTPLRELRFRKEEIGIEGRCVDESSGDLRRGGVLTHLNNSGVNE